MVKINHLLASSQALAAPIVNGDFSQCDFGGWSADKGGGGTIAEQLSIVETPQGCRAIITIDNSPSFINLLYQEVDFTSSTNSPFLFTYEFTIDSELTGQAPGSADYFALGLGDGSGNLFDGQGNYGGFFGMPDIYGRQHYQGSIELAGTFANVSGLSLEFQLFGNFDAAPPLITVKDLSIAKVIVPAPATAALLSLGLLSSSFSLRGHSGDQA